MTDSTLPADGAFAGAASAPRWRTNAPIVEDSRQLSDSETLTSEAHRLGALMAGGILKLKGPVTPEVVRRGLDWLQAEHPMLRAHLVRKGVRWSKIPPYIQTDFMFDTRGTAPIPLRSVVDPDPKAGGRAFQDELRKPIPPGPLPRIKAVLVRPSEDANEGEIIFCIDHTIADAAGAMHVIDQLLEAMADPDGVREPRGLSQPLPPSLEAASPPKPDSGRPYEPIIRLPVAKLPKTEVGTTAERRQFTAAETEAIKEQLKAHRTTMHGLASAAVLKGINQHFHMVEMTVLSTVDLRRRCNPPISPETFGCFIDILRTKHRIDLPLWELASDVAFKLITTIARDQKSASVMGPATWKMMRTEIIPLMRNSWRADGLVVTTAAETRLRRQYGPFRLEDMQGLVSQEVAGGGFFAIITENGGELEMALSYAPHTLAQADAAAVADIAAGLMRQVARGEA